MDANLARAIKTFAEAMKRGHYPELQGVACEAFQILDNLEGK